MTASGILRLPGHVSLCYFVGTSVFAATERPVAVSPGGGDTSRRINQSRPTFSWDPVVGAKALPLRKVKKTSSDLY